jgi:hypothetical protein
MHDSPESASLARPLLLGMDGSDIREGDRLIIHEPSTKGKVEGPRNFACPMVRIMRLEQGRKEGMGGRAKLASSVIVHMQGHGDTRLEWSTGRLRDVEGEEVFEGQTYLLTGMPTHVCVGEKSLADSLEKVACCRALHGAGTTFETRHGMSVTPTVPAFCFWVFCFRHSHGS